MEGKEINLGFDLTQTAKKAILYLINDLKLDPFASIFVAVKMLEKIISLAISQVVWFDTEHNFSGEEFKKILDFIKDQLNDFFDGVNSQRLIDLFDNPLKTISKDLQLIKQRNLDYADEIDEEFSELKKILKKQGR